MSTIANLTKEQQVLHEKYRAEWLGWCTSTEPADRPRVERAIGELYDHINQPRPKFHWAQSPLDALRQIHVLKGSPKGVPISSELGNEWWGQHESYWVCMYMFSCDVLKLQLEPLDLVKLNLWKDLAQSCNWWWPYTEHCVISDKPQLVKVNSLEQLHSEHGPAIVFRDGFSLWVLDGIEVTEQIVDRPETLTVKTIMEEPNSEIRRIMVLRKKPEQFLQEAGAVVIDEDQDKHGPRTLYQFKLPEGLVQGVSVKTVCKDGTVTTDLLWVPESITTCKDAVRATFPTDHYAPINES